MKIVIDIPESIYATIEEDQFITRYQLAVLQSQIRKGVPLPKGHGRLIDADALLQDVREHEESYFAEDFAHHWVDPAPTIIEADKAESEGKA